MAATFGVGFVVLAGLNAGQLAQRVARDAPASASLLLPVLLVGVTGLTLVTSLSSAFHHLFMAGDLELLLAAPVTRRSLFWLKILEIWRDSLHVLIFQAAALYGYGQALRLPAWYYPLALLVGISLTLAASALGAIVTLALARVRFGESVLALSRVVAIVLFLPIGVLGVPALGFGRSRFQPLLSLGGVDAVSSSLQSFGAPPAWAPTTWAAHVLLGDEAALLSLALLAVTAATLAVATQLAFNGLFQPGWERVRFSAPRRAGRAIRIRLRLPGQTPAGPVVGLLQKDYRTLLRDPRWRTGALVSLVALGLPAMVLFAGDPFVRATHAVRFWLGMIPVPYLAYLFGSQHGGATLAYEGRNIALLRAAPVGMGRIMVAKVLGGLAVVLTVTWAATLALAVSHGGEPVETGVALAAATWLGVGATLAAVAGAALTVDFEGDNPQRRAGCLGTLVTSALSMFFFVTNTALLVWWIMRGILSVPRPLLAWLPVGDWGLPALALVSVGTIVVASRIGMRRLAGWEAS
jgi:Putative ATP-binding cassette